MDADVCDTVVLLVRAEVDCTVLVLGVVGVLVLGVGVCVVTEEGVVAGEGVTVLGADVAAGVVDGGVGVLGVLGPGDVVFNKRNTRRQTN